MFFWLSTAACAAFSTPATLCRHFPSSHFLPLHFCAAVSISRSSTAAFLVALFPFSQFPPLLFTVPLFHVSHFQSIRIKIGALKMQFVCIFLYLLNICRQFEFLISQCSNVPKMRWVMLCFVANFTSFPTVQKCVSRLQK